MEKIVQLPLPLLWWQDIEKWRNWITVANVSRPTEDAALQNVFYAARLAGGLKLGTSLSELEQKIYRLERQVKVLPAYSTPLEQAEWIYDKLEKPITTRRNPKRMRPNPLSGSVSGIRHVLAILNDISYAMRGYAQHETWLENNWRTEVATEVVAEFETQQLAIAT